MSNRLSRKRQCRKCLTRRRLSRMLFNLFFTQRKGKYYVVVYIWYKLHFGLFLKFSFHTEESSNILQVIRDSRQFHCYPCAYIEFLSSKNFLLMLHFWNTLYRYFTESQKLWNVHKSLDILSDLMKPNFLCKIKSGQVHNLNSSKTYRIKFVVRLKANRGL